MFIFKKLKRRIWFWMNNETCNEVLYFLNAQKFGYRNKFIRVCDKSKQPVENAIKILLKNKMIKKVSADAYKIIEKKKTKHLNIRCLKVYTISTKGKKELESILLDEFQPEFINRVDSMEKIKEPEITEEVNKIIEKYLNLRIDYHSPFDRSAKILSKAKVYSEIIAQKTGFFVSPARLFEKREGKETYKEYILKFAQRRLEMLKQDNTLYRATKELFVQYKLTDTFDYLLEAIEEGKTLEELIEVEI